MVARVFIFFAFNAIVSCLKRNVMFHTTAIITCCSIVLALQNTEYDQGKSGKLKDDPGEQLCIL
jgi:hypothetical protein